MSFLAVDFVDFAARFGAFEAAKVFAGFLASVLDRIFGAGGGGRVTALAAGGSNLRPMPFAIWAGQADQGPFQMWRLPL